jgi:uncharacterized protein
MTMRKMRITAGDVTATAILSENPTADAVWAALPIAARANTWGDEIYFAIPVHLEEAADSQEIVALGDVGYWPPGHAFCIFFGRTPVSRGNEIRPASAVNVFAKVEGDPIAFTKVSDGAKVTLEQVPE